MSLPARPPRRTPEHAFASLSDPRFVAALVTLILNDWWLKPQIGNWFTGKLSDVAGLVVLPVVVAGVLRALRVPKARFIAFFSIGIWFAAIKTLEPAARATEQLAEALSGTTSVIVVDPTDLVGLGGLFVAAAIVARPRPLLSNKAARGALFAIALVACTASSNDGGTPTDLGLTADGEVVNRGGNLTAEVAVDEAPAAADAVDLEQPAGFGEQAVEACTAGPNETACFRIVDGRVERQRPDGNWELEWALFDTAIVSKQVGVGLNYTPSMHATDILAAPDGSVHVAFDGISPITRSAVGEWDPPVQAFRPVSHMAALVTVAFGAAALAAATKTSGAAKGVASLAFVAMLGLFIWSGATGPIGAFAGGAIAIVAAFAALVWAIGAERQEHYERALVKGSLAVGFAGIVAAFACLLIWRYVVGAPAMLWTLAPFVAFVGVVGANAVTALAER